MTIIDRQMLRDAACQLQASVRDEMRAANGGLAPAGFRWDTALLASLGASVMVSCVPDRSFTDALVDMWERAEHRAMRRAMLVKAPDSMIMTLSGFWARAGFPVIDVGHRYAAALMATDVPELVRPSVKVPWRSFVLRIPAGLALITNSAGKLVELRFVIVGVDSNGRWSYVAITDTAPNGDALFFWRGQESFDTLLVEMTDGAHKDIFSVEIGEGDARTGVLLGRYIANVCLAMSDPSNVKPPRDSKPGGKRRNTPRDSEPRIRTYVLGKPIKLDCREAVAAYARGERRPPSVQVLVRGHWKLQPHGPGNALRKLIWREPYWRGPEEAPINVRKHLVETA